MAITLMAADIGRRLPQISGHLRLGRRASAFRGQSAIEYAVLIAVAAAALVGMSVYTKRALDGKWRGVGDSFGYGRQYDPVSTVSK